MKVVDCKTLAENDERSVPVALSKKVPDEEETMVGSGIQESVA